MNSYSWAYKWLHWLMAALIIVMFLALQGFSPNMSDADRTVMLVGHSSIGTIISALLVIRISKRFVLKHKQPQHDLAPMQTAAAQLNHYALYALMILVPLSGYMTANFHQLPVQLFGSVSLNGTADAEVFSTLRLVHSTLVKALITLVSFHIAAAFWHKWIAKDDVFSSMRPWLARKKKAS